MNLFLLAGAISVGFAGELRTQVLDLLGGYEETASPASLQALGPTVSDELLSIAQDSTVPASRRARAVHALGWFPSDTTRTFLVGTLQGADSTLARKAAYALANYIAVATA